MKIEFTPEDLQAIRLIIREELLSAKPVKEEPKFYTRGEVCGILKITLPTLHAWTTKGRIQKTKIENRVLFAEAEIQRVVQQIKR